MVEASDQNNSVSSDEETTQQGALTLPAVILSIVAFYLPCTSKLRLAQSSIYFNKALQQHFKLLIVREIKTDEAAFERTGSEHLMPSTSIELN